jgi:hypothetical protein
MRLFLFSNSQPWQWLATGAITLLVWPLALAIYLAEHFASPAEAPDAAVAKPASPRTEADDLFQSVNDRYTHSYFGRYRW